MGGGHTVYGGASHGGAGVEVVVLGAGIVGVSVAYAARERGLSVTLVDRREPGSETSYGNAGVLSTGSIFPNNNPALWAKLPQFLSQRHAALRWSPGWAVCHARWLARYLANALPARLQPRAVALRDLSRASLSLHRQWIARAGAGQRIRETGWLKAWRVGGTGAARVEQALLADYGVRSEVLDAAALRALEPSIVPVYREGLLLSDAASVDSPGNTVKDYARMLVRAGGRLVQAEVGALVPESGGWRVRLGGGDLLAQHVVVALGPWTADLLRPLGLRVPLGFERGYHQEFQAHPSRRLGRPILDVEGSFILTPMENGIRVTSGVELAARDAPSSFAQIEAAAVLARGVAEFGAPVGPVWRGARPTLPDSLPMIGAAPGRRGLWLAFGHQHIGFATGPATGAAIAALICGASPPFDTAAFAPARYL